MNKENIKRMLVSSNLDDKKLGMIGLAKLMKDNTKTRSGRLKDYKTSFFGSKFSSYPDHLIIVIYRGFMLNTADTCVYFSKYGSLHYRSMMYHPKEYFIKLED